MRIPSGFYYKDSDGTQNYVLKAICILKLTNFLELRKLVQKGQIFAIFCFRSDQNVASSPPIIIKKIW